MIEYEAHRDRGVIASAITIRSSGNNKQAQICGFVHEIQALQKSVQSRLGVQGAK
jgi:hypothetical protein